MFTKIQITGKIELVTGMHIGGSSAFAAIGAVDSPIVKDVRTKLPKKEQIILCVKLAGRAPHFIFAKQAIIIKLTKSAVFYT